MLEFLYTVKPTRLAMVTEGPTEEESAVLAQHAAYLGGLAERGVVEFAGRTTNGDETTFGLVVFEAESDAAARRIMLEDPAVRHGVMTASLFPYRVAFRAGPSN